RSAESSWVLRAAEILAGVATDAGRGPHARAPRQLPDPAAAQRVRAAPGPRPAAGRSTPARGRAVGQLRGAGLPPRAEFLSRDVPTRLGPGGGQCRHLQRVERVRTGPVRLLRVGALEHRRTAAPAPRRPAGELDDGALAGTRRARRLDRWRFEPGGVPDLSTSVGGLASPRVPLAAGGAAPVSRPAPAPA